MATSTVANARAAAIALAIAFMAQPKAQQTQGVRGFEESVAETDLVLLPLDRGPDSEDVEADGEGEKSRGVSMWLSYEWPMRSREPVQPVGAGGQRAPPVTPTLQLSLRRTLVRASNWFLQGTFYRYQQKERQQAWNPDFSYRFGYEDWQPGSFSFTYANYSGNRLNPDRTRNQRRWNFSTGEWSATYRFAVPQALHRWVVFSEQDHVDCSSGINLTRRYFDLASLSTRKNKTSISAACQYTLANNLFARITLFLYPQTRQQQPWDPDFTYSFGYASWRSNTASLQYSNYSGNRLAWRDRAAEQGSFRNGSITLQWTKLW